MPFKFPIIWAILFGVISIWFPLPLWFILLPFIFIIAFLFCVGAIVLAAVITK